MQKKTITSRKSTSKKMEKGKLNQGGKKKRTYKYKTPRLGHEGTNVLHQNNGKKTKASISKSLPAVLKRRYKNNMSSMLESLHKQCSLSDPPQLDSELSKEETVIHMAVNDIKQWELKTKTIIEQKQQQQKIQVKMLKNLISLLKEPTSQNDELQDQQKLSSKKTKRNQKKFNFLGFRSSYPTHRDQHGLFTAERLFSSTSSPSKSPSRIFPHFPLSSSVLEDISQMDFVFKPTFGNSFFSSQAFSSHMEDDEESGGPMFSPSSSVTKKKMKKKKEVAPSSKRKVINKVNTLPKKRGPKKKIQPNPTTPSLTSSNLNETSSSVDEIHPSESMEAERRSAPIDYFLHEDPYPRVDSPSSMDSHILFNSSYIRRLTSVTKSLRENEIRLLHQNLRLRSPSSKNTRSKIASSNATAIMRKKNAAAMGSLTQNKTLNTVSRKKLKIVTPKKFKTVVTSNFKIVTPKHSQPVPLNKFKRVVGTPKPYLRKVSDKRTNVISPARALLLNKGKKGSRKTATAKKSTSVSKRKAAVQDDRSVIVGTERAATRKAQNNGALLREATKSMQRKLDNASSSKNILSKEPLSEQARNNNLYSSIARTVVHVSLNNISGSDQLRLQNKPSKSQSNPIVSHPTDDSSDDEDSPQLPLSVDRRGSPHHHLSDSINRRASPFNNNKSDAQHQAPRNFKDPPKFYYPVHPFISDDFPVHFIPVDANNIPDFLPLYAPAIGAKPSPKVYPSFVQIRDLHNDAPDARYTFSDGIYSKNVPRQTLHEREVLPNILPGISAAARHPLVPEMNHLSVIKGISKHPADGNRAASPILGSRRKGNSPVKSNWSPNPSTSKVIVRSPTIQAPMVMKLSPPPSMNQMINIRQKIHNCNLCNFTTVKLGVLKRHQLSHSKPDSPPDSNEEILILDSKVRSQVPHTPPLNSMISSSVKITQAPGPAPAPLVAHSESIRLGPHGSPRILSPTYDSESGIKIVSTESLRDAVEGHRNSSLAFLDNAAEMPLQKRFPSVTITPLLQPYD